MHPTASLNLPCRLKKTPRTPKHLLSSTSSPTLYASSKATCKWERDSSGDGFKAKIEAAAAEDDDELVLEDGNKEL
jgi:hypothetical protein